MTDIKMSVGGSKPSGFTVKDILDLPNVKTASSSTETISSLPGTGMYIIIFPILLFTLLSKNDAICYKIESSFIVNYAVS